MSNGINFSFLQEVKSLGIILDSKLSCEPHIKSVGKKVNKLLYTLKFIRKNTTEKLRIRLIQALVTPHLDHCSAVLLNMGVGSREKIQRFSNIGIRYIFGLKKDINIFPSRKRLYWLTINARRFDFCNILIYKILRMNKQNYLT